MLSRTDETQVFASDKVAFLQAWLFFGLINEVSTLCSLELDVNAEFIDDKGSVSTAKLNGLPGRWFAAVMKEHRAGDKELMERLLALVRHVVLMLTEEVEADFTPTFKYTYSECRVLHSLDIGARIVALHLLLHVYTPGFTATDEEGWGRNRISNCLDWFSREVEALDQLSTLAERDLEERGWCKSELNLLGSDDLAFASLLSRPNIRDHSSCGRIICEAYQTDEATYMTRHVQNRCSCDFVGVQTDVLVGAWSEGKVPRLVITEHLELQVMVEHDYPYIAVSHVCTSSIATSFLPPWPSLMLIIRG